MPKKDRRRRRRAAGETLDLGQTILQELSKAPRRLAADLIRQKLRGIGIAVDAVAEEGLAQFIDGIDPTVALAWLDTVDPPFEFSKSDWTELNQSVEEVLLDAPAVVTGTIKSGASLVLKAARRDWKRRGQDRVADEVAFGIRLKGRWGTAFDDLRFLRVLCMEVGTETIDRLRRSRAKSGKIARQVSVRLHARACQVAGEIQVLLESGYADAAMARWRTLYELTIVAMVLSHDGDALAQRYLDHEYIDAKRAMDEYVRGYEGLGFPAPNADELRQVQADFDATIAKHGQDFSGPYGWAADHLSKKKPTFSDLQDSVGKGPMKSFYKMASYPVHAGVKGITWRLSALGDRSLLVAGASNAGLEEPGQHMAFSLTAITSLLARPGNMEDALFLSVISGQRDKAVSSLIRAGKRLKRDQNLISAAR